MKVIHYCQHVLGMGHFFRSLEIAKALDKEQVIFVAGGTKPNQELPANVKYYQLSGLCMDENFGGLMPTTADRKLEDVKKERADSIFRLFEKEKPDVFLIELFPFGRKAFRFELIPVLDAIKEGRFGDVKVICSLRDILVERDDGGKHEARCVKYLNKYFDLLLIHSDPKIASLDETFKALNQITIPYTYTGFAARQPKSDIRDKLRKKYGIADNEKLLIASAGGGKVGGELMNSVFDAFSAMQLEKTRMFMFTGPFFDQNKFDKIYNSAADYENIIVEKFATDFTDLLTAADAMISMAGYNTCMDILTSGTPSAVLPFNQNHEQRMRAEKIAKHIPLKILESKDLIASGMEDVINTLLIRNRSTQNHGIDLDGASKSAQAIRKSG
ncbi:glycosyltransferase family protein [Maridesulfovibrio hydrothermalis]|uniref:Glycosyltransferase 28 domain protein n=1 Tax=Maridesulfovibrio hydrothermalis AM13 = DSM 14728 TaxID=1121451 RepID=L0RGJ9_9BACT|nr:glycosyltransferase [Maridesulfovibrio hydrothermalis]CCO24701.1 Glycosyltransferase 28 domain protein [Maridesulfovibrio hydrothermalis AM13 = DSM 14728]